jgi:hypothetical protein
MEDLDLVQAVDAEEDRLHGRRLPRYPLFMPQAQYRAQARFGEQLERWLEHYPRRQIHVSFLDDLVADPEATVAAIQDFLGIERRSPAADTPTNPVPILRSVRLASALYKPGRADAVRRVLPRRFHPLAGKLVARLSSANVTTAARPALPPDLRDRLRSELEPDLRRLGALLGEDLVARWWGGTSGVSERT